MTTKSEPERDLNAEMIPWFPPTWSEIFGEDKYGIFAEFTLNRTRFVWRWIPPGRFLMGSPYDEAGRYDNEGPQHSVTISRGFWLGETAVSQAQWSAVMGDNPSHFEGEQRPVERVTWHQCIDFVTRLNEQISGLGTSLPNEAEWEYACRAGTQGAFHVPGSQCSEPEGEDPLLDQLGWFEENSETTTHAVKEKPPNSWGLYDMHGNVFEWCMDGMRPYDDQPQSDPQGSMNKSADRVLRGGSWWSRARFCRAAYRFIFRPGYGWSLTGFRLSARQEPFGAERPVL